MKYSSLLLIILLLTPQISMKSVIAQTDQNLEWGFAYDDEVHFMMHLNSTGLQIDEEIYLVSNDTLPSIPNAIDNWTDIPYTGIRAYYANGTQLGIEVLTFVAMYNVYLPIGNWSFLSDLAEGTHTVENFSLDEEEYAFWGYSWEDDDWILSDGGVTIYSNYTINVHVEYLKADGFLANYSVDAFNTTSKADAGEVVLERLGIEKYTETTDPIITNHPGNIVYVEGQVGNTVTWYASDEHPDTYVVIRTIPTVPIASSTVQSGAWNDSSEAITVNVDGFAVGDYYISLIVHDAAGNKDSDRISLSVISESTVIQYLTLISVVAGGLILVTGAILIKRRRKF